MTRRLIAAVLALVGACDWQLHRMNDTPRCEPNEATALFADGNCNQAPPAGTVPWRAPRPEVAELLAIPPTRAMIDRGHARFDRICATCHGALGDGRSQVAEDMTLRPPPSLHSAMIVAYPDQRIYEIISAGYGLMPGYAHELAPSDRRAVVAYLRVLQHSQDVRLDQLPPALREEAHRWLP
jgi:mono/diheme cytochrome c family protein